MPDRTPGCPPRGHLSDAACPPHGHLSDAGRPPRGHLSHGQHPPCPAIILDDPAWRRAIPGVGRLVTRAARAAGGAGTVMLSSDRAVRTLNRLHRGIDRPTNVLTFEPASAAAGGDIVLAYATMRREARAARRSLADHLAHLVVHGALHLRGEDHVRVADARRMEAREARILHRLGVANPWKPSPDPPPGRPCATVRTTPP